MSKLFIGGAPTPHLAMYLNQVIPHAQYPFYSFHFTPLPQKSISHLGSLLSHILKLYLPLH